MTWRDRISAAREKLYPSLSPPPPPEPITSSQREALFALVELAAPDTEPARARLARALAHAPPSPDPAESALLDALLGSSPDEHSPDSALICCDWRSEPWETREMLEDLSTFPPGLTWDWYDWDGDWEPGDEDQERFLWPLGDRCLRLGTGLVGVETSSDSYTLGFLAADKLGQFGTLAATAGVKVYQYQTGSELA